MTRFWLVPALLLWGGRSAFGFALAGPIANAGDAWQSPTIGYGLGPPNFATDQVAPKNLAEGYRWNTRNIYYAYDTAFLDYFGTNGAAHIDQAFAILNSLSNVDSYTPNLSEWPLTSSGINYAAEEVRMYDLTSVVLVQMMEQLGLAEPDRYVFTLHSRIPPVTGPPCPNYEYLITQRNFDPVTQNYSQYVNGVLYAFAVLDYLCLNTPGPDPEAPIDADCINFPVDPEQTADGLTAVAAGLFNGIPNPTNSDLSVQGRYYLGLTRDDVGGFRYLLSSNTIITESVEPNSLLQQPAPPSLLVTSNLAVLEAALTNTPAALQALFPTLQITGETGPTFTEVTVTNYITVTDYAACIGQPVGCVPPVVQEPVVTTNLLPIYGYSFGNVQTNFTYTNNGVLVTNATNEYILVPVNGCGFEIFSNALATVVTTTNTNTLAVTIFTNHTLVVDIFNCVPNSVALREGMEKMNFFRVDYEDGGASTNWPGVTNTYTLIAVTNNHPLVQTFYRVTTQPDIIFSAADLAGGPASVPVALGYGITAPDFNQANILPGLAGPGTIVPRPLTFTFNKSGPIYEFDESTSSFVTPLGGPGNPYISAVQWASFDGTTNTPITYPVNTSYQSLVNNIFLQITTPGSLPDGTVNVSYSTELQASGAAPPPYTYSLVSGSGALPDGLSLGLNSGIISGTPTVVGIFDFSVSVSDSAGRASQGNFSIEIDQ